MRTGSGENRFETLEGLADYMDLGLSYEGDVKMPNGSKLWMEIESDDIVYDSNLVPKNSLAVVYGPPMGTPLMVYTLEMNKEGKSKVVQYTDDFSDANTAAGFAFGGAELAMEQKSIAFMEKHIRHIGSMKNISHLMRTYSVTIKAVGKIGGFATFGIGVVLDGHQHFVEESQTGVKFWMNTGAATAALVVGLWVTGGAIPAFIFSALYFGLDYYGYLDWIPGYKMEEKEKSRLRFVETLEMGSPEPGKYIPEVPYPTFEKPDFTL